MFAQITQFLVETLTGFFVFLLLARFHFQWLRVSFRNQIGEFVIVCTNWLVRPARRVIPPLGGFDLATGIAAWLLQAVALWAALALRGWDAGASVGAAIAVLAGLAIVDLLRFSLYLLMFAIFVQIVLSWVSPQAPAGALFEPITRPFLRPVRRVVPLIANIDLSPLVLLVLLQVLLIPLAHLRAGVGAALLGALS
ncbi:MAG: YggT family protein [Proteobacteria bacterium]|nr:YggT family protein [Pseudomonadota bacterium]